MSDKKLFYSGLMAALSVSFLFSNAFADGGVYMEQEIQTKLDGVLESSEQVKIWISGDFIRFDSSRQPNYTVIDSKRSLMWIVDSNNKVYMEFPIETNNGSDAKGRELEVLQKIEKTGHVKKIGKWDCFEVEVFTEIKEPTEKKTVKLKAGRTFLWLTESSELENEKIKDALMRSLSGFGIRDSSFAVALLRRMDSEFSGESQVIIKGLPVQVVTIAEVESVGKKSVRETDATIKEIKVIDIPAMTFQIPAGYRKLTGN